MRAGAIQPGGKKVSRDPFALSSGASWGITEKMEAESSQRGIRRA